MAYTRLWLAAVAVSLVMMGCGGEDEAEDGTTQDCPTLQHTFSSLQAEFFSKSCAFTACHGSGAEQQRCGRAGGLILDDAAACTGSGTTVYGNLVNTASHDSPSEIRVIPGDPDNSYLMKKLKGTPGIAGDRMPRGEQARDCEIAMVAEWIAAGAPNN